LVKKIITGIFILIGGSIGASVMPIAWNMAGVENLYVNNMITNILIGAIIFLFISFLAVAHIEQIFKKIEAFLNQQSLC